MKPTRWQDTFAGAFALTLARIVLASPLLLLGLALCLTFMGIPLGFPLMLVVSHWCTHPLRRIPQMNIRGDAE